jgi:hypothetical protein
MTHVLLLLSLVIPGAEPEDAHEKSNPLFKHLRQTGVAISDKTNSPLPAPCMADDLDAGAQKAVIKELIRDDYDYDGFTASSVAAPYMLLPLREVKGGNADAPGRALDLYFVAHGKLKNLTDKDLLQELGRDQRNKGEGKALTAEDLKKRGITIAPEAAKREGYGHGSFNLLDKVEVAATGHSFWSETADSVVLAAEIDPRFTADKEFPNQWRSLEKNGEGGFATGPPQPYQGVGYYVKVTRLKEPEGALFVECHAVFLEPTKWFNGTNMLTSKLPSIVQEGLVRKLRKELIKADIKDG